MNTNHHEYENPSLFVSYSCEFVVPNPLPGFSSMPFPDSCDPNDQIITFFTDGERMVMILVPPEHLAERVHRECSKCGRNPGNALDIVWWLAFDFTNGLVLYSNHKCAFMLLLFADSEQVFAT